MFYCEYSKVLMLYCLCLVCTNFCLNLVNFTRWQQCTTCIETKSVCICALHNASCGFSHVRSGFDLHQETHWSLPSSAGLSSDIWLIIKHYPSFQPKYTSSHVSREASRELLGWLPFRLPSSLHQFIMWWMSPCHNINPNAKSAVSAQEIRVGWRSDNKNCCVRMHISGGQYLRAVIL